VSPALGYGRGGFSTKVHLACDRQGLPLATVLTAGQRHESVVFPDVMDAVAVPRPRGRTRKRPDAQTAGRANGRTRKRPDAQTAGRANGRTRSRATGPTTPPGSGAGAETAALSRSFRRGRAPGRDDRRPATTADLRRPEVRASQHDRAPRRTAEGAPAVGGSLREEGEPLQGYAPLGVRSGVPESIIIRRSLVFVHQKAYQQPFPRGLYVIDTRDTVTTGPLVELFEATRLGNDERYIIDQKYVREGDPLSGNFAHYDLADSTWQWITSFPEDSLVRYVDVPVPSPTQDLLVQSREVQNADQLFLMDERGENVRQITELGGDIPRWSLDGGYFIFRRDVHRGEGARYVPFRFDLGAMTAQPLWPALADSVPDFPDLSTQSLDATSTRR
jgi:hypothetical protein